MSKRHERYEYFIFVCKDKDCKKAGAKDLEKAFEKSIKKSGLNKTTKVFECACTNRCKEAPVAIVNNRWLGKLDPKKVDAIIEESF